MDRTVDPHGVSIMTYIKEGVHFKCRNDLEIRETENIWIEIISNHKKILFRFSYRPPNSDAQYCSNIEASIALAIDMGISDMTVTGDFLMSIQKRK